MEPDPNVILHFQLETFEWWPESCEKLLWATLTPSCIDDANEKTHWWTGEFSIYASPKLKNMATSGRTILIKEAPSITKQLLDASRKKLNNNHSGLRIGFLCFATARWMVWRCYRFLVLKKTYVSKPTRFLQGCSCPRLLWSMLLLSWVTNWNILLDLGPYKNKKNKLLP